MTKFWNCPLWLHLQIDQSRNCGAMLVELLIALAIATLILVLLVTMLQSQLQAHKTTVELSEAFQNAWIATIWLKRDLQATQSITISPNKREVTLKVPYISVQNQNEVKWRTIKYFFRREQAQLQRSITNSHNLVGEGIVNFTISLDRNKRLASISLASKEGSKCAQINTKIWLRNLRE